MTTRRLSIWLLVAVAALLCSPADARLVENWSFQRLNDTADLVLIATAASTEQWPEKLLFLKKRSDGRYEPISGQIDSAFSASKLSDSSWLDLP